VEERKHPNNSAAQDFLIPPPVKEKYGECRWNPQSAFIGIGLSEFHKK
jgi:hypothetical protein